MSEPTPLVPANANIRLEAERLYLLLAALFMAALVTCNLIANKFVTVDLRFLGFAEPFTLSAGVLPFPITFLITDVLSEIYGKARTQRVVFMGFFALIFTTFILWLGAQFPAIATSPISDAHYQIAFGNSWRVIAASMAAYLVAQLVDVRLFHFWKDLTNGQHLWLRNNASTIFSQLVDTTLVVGVLFIGTLPLGTMGNFIWDGWLFKSLCALADTPLIYAISALLRRRFGLKFGQELGF
ncbi:MAG: queuosine precursor transporter [Bacteroidota bacterium]